MSETFNSTIAGVLGTVQRSRGVAVTYHRGSDFVPISATPAEDRYLADDGNGFLTHEFVRDYLIAAADLDFSDGPTPPQRGDVIRERFGANTVKVYEVVALGSEPHYRYMDPGHTMLRVHTKWTDTETT